MIKEQVNKDATIIQNKINNMQHKKPCKLNAVTTWYIQSMVFNETSDNNSWWDKIYELKILHLQIVLTDLPTRAETQQL